MIFSPCVWVTADTVAQCPGLDREPCRTGSGETNGPSDGSVVTGNAGCDGFSTLHSVRVLPAFGQVNRGTGEGQSGRSRGNVSCDPVPTEVGPDGNDHARECVCHALSVSPIRRVDPLEPV